MLLWLLYPILEASIQGIFFKLWPTWFNKHFDPHKEPMYLRIIRGAAYFAWAIWLQYQIDFDYHIQSTLVYFLITVAFAMTSFWIIFDLLLNWFRNKRWNHTGINSGYLDNINNYLIWKGVALVVAILTGYLGIILY